MSDFKLVHNVETGQISETALTADEIAQNKKDAEDAVKIKAQAKAQADKKAAAEAKLVALGLTADDLKALGL